MTRLEETQYAVSGIGVVEGADLDFQQPSEAPCRDCGSMVDLTSDIIVNIQRGDGSEASSTMSEADARALLVQVEMMPPPVLCGPHAWVENPMRLPSG